MSSEIIELRLRIAGQRFSRWGGLRAICAAAEKYAKAQECGPAITYDWLRRFADGSIKNPGYERIERLKAVLDEMNQPGKEEK